MAKFLLDSDTIVDTGEAAASWEECDPEERKVTRLIPRDHSFEHEKLFRSKKGNYYMMMYNDDAADAPWSGWVSPKDAVVWLLTNGHKLPKDLEQYADEILE